MFKWKEDYSIGVELIDSQHEELFNIANKAYDLLKNDFFTDKYDKIIEILEELKEYTIFHFKTEEEFMLNKKYKKFFSHKIEHDNFMQKINDVDLKKVDQEQQKHLMDILEFVVQWINQHILERDKFIMVD